MNITVETKKEDLTKKAFIRLGVIYIVDSLFIDVNKNNINAFVKCICIDPINKRIFATEIKKNELSYYQEVRNAEIKIHLQL